MVACKTNICWACTLELTLTPSSDFINRPSSSSTEWETIVTPRLQRAANQCKSKPVFPFFFLLPAYLRNTIRYNNNFYKKKQIFSRVVHSPLCSAVTIIIYHCSQATEGVANYTNSICNCHCISHTLCVQCVTCSQIVDSPVRVWHTTSTPVCMTVQHAYSNIVAWNKIHHTSY